MYATFFVLADRRLAVREVLHDLAIVDPRHHVRQMREAQRLETKRGHHVSVPAARRSAATMPSGAVASKYATSATITSLPRAREMLTLSRFGASASSALWPHRRGVDEIDDHDVALAALEAMDRAALDGVGDAGARRAAGGSRRPARRTA